MHWPDEHASETLTQGLEVRRQVLGGVYVDQAIANVDPLTEPLQNLVTEYCWGSVWTREGLPRKTRSLLNIVMMTALNRPHELEIHLRGAIANGCREEEIAEAILQSAVYCGVPAGIDAMRIFDKVRGKNESMPEIKYG